MNVTLPAMVAVNSTKFIDLCIAHPFVKVTHALDCPRHECPLCEVKDLTPYEIVISLLSLLFFFSVFINIFQYFIIRKFEQKKKESVV